MVLDQLKQKTVLGVPVHYLLIAVLIQICAALFLFWPAILHFGTVLIGVEDIKYFIWMFWHFQTSLASGQNPFHASEIFYPYGTALTNNATTFPLISLFFVFLPASISAFAKITIIQLLSVFLGAIFSFALVYRFCRSFLPALAGSIVVNLSAFHIQNLIYHLNFAIAVPFTLFFLFEYFQLVEGDRSVRRLILCAVALLLVGLTEMTVVVMLGFILFLDIFIRYCNRSGIKFSLKNILIITLGAILSLVIHELLILSSVTPWISYILPSSAFLGACLFVLGIENLKKSESEFAYLKSMILISLPVLLYLLFLILQPSQLPLPGNSIILDSFTYGTSEGYLIFPTSLQAISAFIPPWSLATETDIYVGVLSFLLLFYSLFSSKVSEQESFFRNLTLLCIFFSFPFLPMQAAFPLLPILRVLSRFMLFADIFLAIFISLVLKRILESNLKWAKIIVLLILLGLFVERLPIYSNSVSFNQPMPEFYSQLKPNDTIFLFANFNYYTLLNEVYYQTLHGKPLSYGSISRFPDSGNPLFDYYAGVYFDQGSPFVGLNQALSSANYTYLVMQMQTCDTPASCYVAQFHSFNQSYIEQTSSQLTSMFGNPIYQDNEIMVYNLSK